MKTRKASSPKFVLCIKNSGYPASPEPHKVYRIMPDEDAAEDGDIRVLDESGEDYLYPADYFVTIEVPREKARALNKSMKSGNAVIVK